MQERVADQEGAEADHDVAACPGAFRELDERRSCKPPVGAVRACEPDEQERRREDDAALEAAAWRHVAVGDDPEAEHESGASERDAEGA